LKEKEKIIKPQVARISQIPAGLLIWHSIAKIKDESPVQPFRELHSAVSVEQAWKDVFPSRAALLGGFCRASGDTKSPNHGAGGECWMRFSGRTKVRSGLS
jgi:hypothetical protein